MEKKTAVELLNEMDPSNDEQRNATAIVELLREASRKRRQLMETVNAAGLVDLKLKEDQLKAISRLLGEDCSPLQLRLFVGLLDGGMGLSPWGSAMLVEYGTLRLWYGTRTPLRESDLIEIVYPEETLVVDEKPKTTTEGGTGISGNIWEQLAAGVIGVRIKQAHLTKKERRGLSNRLRKAAQMLNARLRKRHVPFSVVRPCPGWLYLWATAYPDALAEARERCMYPLDPCGEEGPIRRRKWTKKEFDDLSERLKQACRRAQNPNAPPPSPVDLPACIAFIEAELANGPRERDAVYAAWRERGGRPNVIRQARERLKVEYERRGGSHGGVWINLPNSQNKDSAQV